MEKGCLNMELLALEEDFVVCVKPVGMDSEQAVPQALAGQIGGAIYPVHRLDQAVGGVMVFARTKAGTTALSQCIQAGSMVKEYQALVHGQPPERGDWEDLLWKDSAKNKVFVVKRLRKGVKAARLTFLRLTVGADSLVHIRLYTGRSHQIRVQFASRGFPLVGDHKYGARDAATAPMLYSCKLSFPWKGKQCTYTSIPPWGEANYLQKMASIPDYL